MQRRSLLASMAGLGTVGTLTGCLRGSAAVATFERTDTDLAHDDPPEVTVAAGDGDAVEIVVRGTVEYGSSTCSTVELAHAEFHPSNDRLDVLVTAAHDAMLPLGCTDDLARSGYEVRVGVTGGLRYVTATEHHRFGEAYSTRHERG